MARIQEPITIKRYGNSRLYNANVGSYMSLQDIAVMVEDDEDLDRAVVGSDGVPWWRTLPRGPVRPGWSDPRAAGERFLTAR